MKCNINACVGLLCAFTISLHLYLHTHRSEALPPKLPAHGVPRSRRPGTAKRVSWGRTFRSKKARETDRVIGKASMWDRRYAYSPRPPHNAAPVRGHLRAERRRTRGRCLTAGPERAVPLQEHAEPYPRL